MSKETKWIVIAMIVAAVIGGFFQLFAKRVPEILPEKRLGAPQAEITSPKHGQVVDRTFVVDGQHANISRESHLWLAIEIGGLLWPKEPEIRVVDKRWSVSIAEGGDPLDSHFSIVLFQVTKDGHATIRHWMTSGEKTGEWPGINPEKLAGYSPLDIISNLKFYNKDETASSVAVVPKNDPAQIVEDIFNSMSHGKINGAMIIYGENQKPIPPIHTSGKMFHGVKFPLEEIKVTRYDPKTKSVSYFCRVPHPAVVFWQYSSTEPSELSYIPKGLEMQGQLYLVKDEQFGFRIKITNDTNPISLYNKVTSNINRMWYMAVTNPRMTTESINFNVFMLIASYQRALNIPEKDDTFVEKMSNEFNRVHPK